MEPLFIKKQPRKLNHNKRYRTPNVPLQRQFPPSGDSNNRGTLSNSFQLPSIRSNSNSRASKLKTPVNKSTDSGLMQMLNERNIKQASRLNEKRSIFSISNSNSQLNSSISRSRPKSLDPGDLSRRQYTPYSNITDDTKESLGLSTSNISISRPNSRKGTGDRRQRLKSRGKGTLLMTNNLESINEKEEQHSTRNKDLLESTGQKQVDPDFLDLQMQMTRGDYFSILNQQSKQEIVKKCIRFFLCDNDIRELKNELASFSKLIFNGVFMAEHISLSSKSAIFKPSEINITYPKKGIHIF